MTMYRFTCDACGTTMSSEKFVGIGGHHELPCIVCHTGNLIRVAVVNVMRGLGEHYNYSLGKYVKNQRDFNDGLKRAAEDQFLQCGIEDRYIEVDPSDRKALGVTDEGVDEKFAEQAGESKKSIII